MCHFQVRSEEHWRGHKALLFLTMQTGDRHQSFKISLEGKLIHGEAAWCWGYRYRLLPLALPAAWLTCCWQLPQITVV